MVEGWLSIRVMGVVVRITDRALKGLSQILRKRRFVVSGSDSKARAFLAARPTGLSFARSFPSHLDSRAMTSASPVILHFLHTSRADSILWLLEELELEYQLQLHERQLPSGRAPPELK